MSLVLNHHALKAALEPLRAKRFIVALSGGLDSVVLLALLVKLRDEGFLSSLQAVHVNHQLSPNAMSWQQHCSDLCGEWKVPLQSVAIDLSNCTGGLEEAARNLRYSVLEMHSDSASCVVFAHHRQDQVETVLYRMIRGSGARGLGGMPGFRNLGDSMLTRPLLPFSREQIQNYADANQLSWVEDESNLSPRFDRNFLRNQVLPILRERWPHVDARLIKQAERMAEDAVLLDELAAEDLKMCQTTSSDVSYWISHYKALWLPESLGLSDARQRNLLRYWLRRSGVTVPGEAVLEEILSLIGSREDANPLVCWNGWEMRRYQQYLVVMQAIKEPVQLEALDSESGSQELKSNGSLFIEHSCDGAGCIRADLPDLSISYRQYLDPSQRIRLTGREGSKSLKKIMQEHRLPPWLRDRIPLLVSAGRLVAAPDLWIAEGYVAEEGQAGLRLSWRPPNSVVTH